MSEIIKLQNIDGQSLASSREVAENFNKNHKEVLRSIEHHIKTLGGAQKCAGLFIASKYQHHQNKQWYKEFLLTRDGFCFAVMSFNGEDAAKWKLKYIEAFNKMEQQLKNPFRSLSPELQAIFSLDEKQQALDTRITDIEDKMTVNYELAENLRSAISCRAIELLGGKGAEAYKKLNKKLFAAFHRDIKRTFKVNSYKNISIKNYEAAINYINKWQPKDAVLMYAIDGLNRQVAFA